MWRGELSGRARHDRLPRLADAGLQFCPTRGPTHSWRSHRTPPDRGACCCRPHRPIEPGQSKARVAQWMGRCRCGPGRLLSAFRPPDRACLLRGLPALAINECDGIGDPSEIFLAGRESLGGSGALFVRSFQFSVGIDSPLKSKSASGPRTKPELSAPSRHSSSQSKMDGKRKR